MSLFRGYIEVSDDKKPLGKFKDTGGKPFREVKDCRGYAGVLAQDTVLIDVDDDTWGGVLFNIVKEKDLQCQVRKTDRGYHFYFKNDGSFTSCGTKRKLAIGIEADIKVGVSTSLANLKLRGNVRPVIFDRYEDEEYDVVPKWLRVVSTNIDLLGLGNGDGRNDAMFKYIMPLQSIGLNKDEIRECLNLVNKYIFDKPLSESEFNTVTRDDAFETALVPKFFGEKNKFLFEVMAKYLVQEHHIKRINGLLHVFDGEVYVYNDSILERYMLDLVDNLTAQQRAEVLKYIAILCLEDYDTCSADFIAFNNGILNINTGEMGGFSPNFIITNKIPFNYNPDAYNEVVDRTFNKMACNKSDVRKCMEELTGYCFYRRNELRKAFILTGEKSNGKSTFIHMLRTMLGKSNYTALDMNEVGHRFRGATLAGKLANLGDDISAEFISDPSQFKKLVSGEDMMGENKGEKPFVFNNYAKFVFSANDVPRTRDKTGAVMDRLVIIPFKATFSTSDPDFDPFIKDKLCSNGAIEYLIKLGVDALREVLDRRRFTICAEGKAELEALNKLNNPILEFLEEIDEDELTREPIDHWYSKYSVFCVKSGLTPLTRTVFSREVKKNVSGLDVERRRVNGERIRFFVAK